MAKRVKRESDFEEKGRRGLAEVVRISATKLRVDFYPNEDLDQKAESFNVEVVRDGENDTIPEYLPFGKLKDGQKFQASVTMNDGGNKILFAVPASGYFEAKFGKFITQNDEAPAWVTKKSKKGKKNYRDADCLLELTGGVWQGITIKEGVWLGANYFYRIYDNLVAGEDGNLAVAGSGTGSDNLADFLDAVIDGGEHIPYSENPLPALQDEAYALDRRFNVNVAKGWVVGIVKPLSLDDEEEIGFLQDDNEPPMDKIVDDVPDALKD